MQKAVWPSVLEEVIFSGVNLTSGRIIGYKRLKEHVTSNFKPAEAFFLLDLQLRNWNLC
jgi:hypothetical protein